jgi:predicted phosphodiesterase
MANYLFIPDIHAPFVHPCAIDFLKDLKRHYKPADVFFLGDLVDQAALSKFTHDPDGMSPGYEFERAVECLQDFYSLFPRAKCCVGNHDLRIFKRASEIGIPARLLKTLRDIYGLPTRWALEENFTLSAEHGDVFITHGDGFSGRNAPQSVLQTYRMNTVMGHLHSVAGTYYLSNGSLNWAMFCGCLIDRKAYAFQYGKHSKDQPICGAGVLVDGVPFFIPL